MLGGIGWTGSGGSYMLGGSSQLGLVGSSSTRKVRIGRASCTLSLSANVLAVALCSTKEGVRLPSSITASVRRLVVARTGSPQWQCSPQGPLEVQRDGVSVIGCTPGDLGTVLVHERLALERSKTSQG